MKKMFTLIAGGCLLSLAFGCQGNKPMDAAQLQAKADSVYTVKASALRDSANTACTTGMAGRVQVLTDSIVAASQNPM